MRICYESGMTPFNIQLFADAGAAADGGTAVVGQNHTAGAAEGNAARLRELGVPDAVLNRRAKRGAKAADGVMPTQQHSNRPGGQQLMQDPEYNAETQKVVSKGVNAVKQQGPRPKSEGELRSHFDSLQQQAAAMQGRYGDFDLRRELDNPVFFKLTCPEVGLSVEDAYMAVHHREMTRAVTEGMKRELSNAIRAGGARPQEHGLDGRAAAVAQFDYRNASRAQRKAFKQQIYDAAARGEKIYPVNRERF